MSLARQSLPVDEAAGHPAIDDFVRTGAHLFPRPLDADAAASLLAKVRATRRFDDSLFLSQSDFEADPVYVGVNPRPGRNLLERFEPDLAFVERDPQIIAALSAMLGDGYQVLNKKLVAACRRAPCPIGCARGSRAIR